MGGKCPVGKIFFLSWAILNALFGVFLHVFTLVFVDFESKAKICRFEKYLQLAKFCGVHNYRDVQSKHAVKTREACCLAHISMLL